MMSSADWYSRCTVDLGQGRMSAAVRMLCPAYTITSITALSSSVRCSSTIRSRISSVGFPEGQFGSSPGAASINACMSLVGVEGRSSFQGCDGISIA